MRISKLSTGKTFLVAVIILLVTIRLIVPRIVLNRLNVYLSQFSPVYLIHIEDLNLHFFRMAYRFENVSAIYKKRGEKFFKVESIDVSLAWRELIKGRVLADVEAKNGEFVLTKALTEGAKKPEAQTEEKAEEASDKLFPVRIALIDIHSSTFDFSDLIKIQPATRWRVSEIEAKVFNFTPTEKEPITFFTAQVTLLDSARFRVAGKAKKLDKPPSWKIDTELKNFDLVAANPMLLVALPFTFTAGSLDLYSEVRSQNNLLEGYVKPFMKNVTVLPKNGEYKGVKHFAFEIIGAVANSILRKSDDKSLATRIAFHRDGGELIVDKDQAVSKAIEHGFEKGLKPGIEDSLDLK